MAARWNLTGGAIEGIMAGQQYEKPLLQVLGQKKVMGGQSGGPERYRLLLSDGEHTNSSAMLATQLNEKVTSGQMDTNSIIRLDKYICNAIQLNKRVLILLEVTILASGAEVGSKIGNPQPMRAAVGGDQNASAAVPEQKQVNNQPSNKAGFLGNGSDINRNTRPAAVSTASNFSSVFQRETNTQNNKGFHAGNQNQEHAAVKSYGGAAANVSTAGDTPSKVHHISSLTPYQNRWTIRARVTQKSAIRSWSNSRGEGTLFSMTLLDESGDIRATAFKTEVDKFYNLIEVNKVYYISKAVLKTANKQFSSANSDYEMTFTSETEVVPCDDVCDLPTITFNFVPINQLESHKSNDTIDVIGVVKEVDDVRMIVAKQTNKELKKREVVLVDESKVQVRLTLWGNDAETFDGSGNPVLAIRGSRVSDWGGRSLSAGGQSQIILNPDIPESHRLRGWFDSVGRSVDYVEYKREGGTGAGMSGANSNWKTFADVKGQNLGQDKADYFTTKATFVFMRKENSMYQACPQTDCNKKVVDQGNGTYRCEKCQKEFPDYKWRMILSANLADFSDNQWITCFQETAEAVLGKSADEIGQLKEGDVSSYDRMFAEANFKSYIFRLRAKMETYNDESRLKTVCVQASPINYLEYNQKLISDIESLLGSV